jgi:hypothetical protein
MKVTELSSSRAILPVMRDTRNIPIHGRTYQAKARPGEARASEPPHNITIDERRFLHCLRGTSWVCSRSPREAFLDY